jgi:hypothetical protein
MGPETFFDYPAILDLANAETDQLNTSKTCDSIELILPLQTCQMVSSVGINLTTSSHQPAYRIGPKFKIEGI